MSSKHAEKKCYSDTASRTTRGSIVCKNYTHTTQSPALLIASKSEASADEQGRSRNSRTRDKGRWALLRFALVAARSDHRIAARLRLAMAPAASRFDYPFSDESHWCWGPSWPSRLGHHPAPRVTPTQISRPCSRRIRPDKAGASTRLPAPAVMAASSRGRLHQRSPAPRSCRHGSLQRAALKTCTT